MLHQNSIKHSERRPFETQRITFYPSLPELKLNDFSGSLLSFRDVRGDGSLVPKIRRCSIFSGQRILQYFSIFLGFLSWTFQRWFLTLRHSTIFREQELKQFFIATELGTGLQFCKELNVSQKVYKCRKGTYYNHGRTRVTDSLRSQAHQLTSSTGLPLQNAAEFTFFFMKIFLSYYINELLQHQTISQRTIVIV